jgi:DNA-binding NarL/FixJ family response regulator
MPHSVLIVDDHKILRDGIKAILERSTDFLVVGEAENGTDAVRLCRKLQPDLVVMDLGLPGMNGVEATTQIVRRCPRTKVMILTISADEASLMTAFRSGARAYVVKKASGADLLDALRIVSQGGSYLSSEVSDLVMGRIQRGELDTKTLGPLDSLSPRERQVLQLVAEGKTSKEIANILELGVQTVRTYRKTLMKKLGVTNVAMLTQIAISAGYTQATAPTNEHE